MVIMNSLIDTILFNYRTNIVPTKDKFGNIDYSKVSPIFYVKSNF